MAEVVNMPRLSDTMEEGVVAKWLKQEGDTVEEGEILAEIETDKATMEFESFHDGVLLHQGIKEGEGASVDTLLAVIGEKGEDVQKIIANQGKDSGGDEKNDASDHKKEPAESKEEPTESKNNDTDSESGGSDEMPEDVEIVTMPRLSDTMEDGTVAQWLKQEGDTVEEGEILAEIETDKATMEFESFFSGKLIYIGIKDGETAPVDDVLAVIGPDGTSREQVVKALKSGETSSEDKETEEAKDTTSSKKESAAEEEAPSDDFEAKGRVIASPLAKSLAKEKGYDIRKIRGSGENGRVVKSDVENYQPKKEKPASAEVKNTETVKAEEPREVSKTEKEPQKQEPAQKEAPKEQKTPEKQETPAKVYQPVGEESFQENKNSQMRKTIAKRLLESKNNAPHYYLTIEADMNHAIESRKQINELPDVKVSFNDMVIKATAMALRKHPQVNSSWNGETTKIAEHIHVGVAVAVEDGLLVPTLKFADQQSLQQINGNVKSLAKKAQTKKLQPDEMEGSTFTVSNLGMFGIEEFTSIINQPNSCILSVGAIIEKPVVENGEIVVGNRMKLTLACDHRTVDGATGSKFLNTLKTYLENPVTMLA